MSFFLPLVPFLLSFSFGRSDFSFLDWHDRANDSLFVAPRETPRYEISRFEIYRAFKVSKISNFRVPGRDAVSISRARRDLDRANSSTILRTDSPRDWSFEYRRA